MEGFRENSFPSQSGDCLCRPPGDCLYDCSGFPPCCDGKVPSRADHPFARARLPRPWILERESTRTRSNCCRTAWLLSGGERPLRQQRQVSGRGHHRPRVCPLASPPWLCSGLPQLQSGTAGLYNAARAANVWGGSHYAMTDFKEYFAEGVQSFFNCNMADSYAPTDRNQLSRRDPNLYAFLLRYLGNNTWSHSC